MSHVNELFHLFIYAYRTLTSFFSKKITKMKNCRRPKFICVSNKKQRKEKSLSFTLSVLPWISAEKLSQELHCSGDGNLYNSINRCVFERNRKKKQVKDFKQFQLFQVHTMFIENHTLVHLFFLLFSWSGVFKLEKSPSLLQEKAFCYYLLCFIIYSIFITHVVPKSREVF